MSPVREPQYDQILLLPPALDEWLPLDHPARFIREFVEMLDLDDLGFVVPTGERGRPPYSADMLLKVWVFGYMFRIRSSRKLERACRDNISLLWLTGMHYPDHNTLWRFFRVNRQALRKVFRATVLVAQGSGLVGLLAHILDGTRIAAQVAREKGWNKKRLEKKLRELDEAIEEILEQIEAAEVQEQGEYRLPEELVDTQERRAKIAAVLQELDEAGTSNLHPSDRDARMVKSGGQLVFGYNAQAAVDEGSGIIVAAELLNEAADNGALVPMIESIEQTLGENAQETVTDGGYYAPEQLATAEKMGKEVLVSLKGNTKLPPEGARFHKFHFQYDEERDEVICPEGKRLVYERTKKNRTGKFLERRYRCHHHECPYRAECSKEPRGRSLDWGPYEGVVRRQAEKQQQPEKQALLKRRMVVVEPVFAQVKANMEFRQFTVRGLENVQTQWSLVCSAFNLQKLFRRWQAGKLIILNTAR